MRNASAVAVYQFWQRAKKQREEVGVELYGFQQNLAKLQLSLEKAQGNYQSLSDSRVQVSSMQHQASARQCVQVWVCCYPPCNVHEPSKSADQLSEGYV